MKLDGILCLDTETYSEVDLKVHGLDVYARSVEVTLLAWSYAGAPAQLWQTTEPMPPELHQLLNDDTVQVWAHNAPFDRTVTRLLLADYAVPVADHRWRCSMAMALSHGLPASLSWLGRVLNIPLGKIEEGKDLISIFCVPHKGKRITPADRPEAWARFCQYVVRDVDAMVQCMQRMPNWNYKGSEIEVWQLDQLINARGIPIDMMFVSAGAELLGVAKADIRIEALTLTNGAIGNLNQLQKMAEYLQMYHGVPVSSLTKDVVDRLLRSGSLTEGAEQLLRLRQESGKTSTAKYLTLLDMVVMGRLRHSLQYAGAGRTTRWAGRGAQMHNLPRPDRSHDEILDATRLILSGQGAMYLEQPRRALSVCVRGVIKAKTGKKLIVSDLSNIEGRSQAWLANEKWKLDAFKAYDLDAGPDLYKLAYAKTFNVDVASVTKDQRQVGKVMELALGYAGGVNAFATFAVIYNVNLKELAKTVTPTLPKEVYIGAMNMRQWLIAMAAADDEFNPPPPEMPTFVWLALESLKQIWRSAHPAIVNYWHGLQEHIGLAMLERGEWITFGKLRLRVENNILRVVLPSNRSLCYPSLHTHERKLIFRSFKLGGWRWERTHKGKIFENLCQKLARDILAVNMLEIEKAGYTIVHHVHDEVICEVPDSAEFTEARLSELLSARPPWAAGFPLAAAGHEMKRYAKMD